jgi:hypothetical protein
MEGSMRFKIIFLILFTIFSQIIFAGSVQDAVTDLYKIILNRQPDQGGLNWWTNQISSGQRSFADTMHEFIFSAEFNQIAYSKSDTEFLKYTYQQTFNRAPDSSGFNWWLNQMRTVGYERKALFEQFVQSPEFRQSHPDLFVASSIQNPTKCTPSGPTVAQVLNWDEVVQLKMYSGNVAVIPVVAPRNGRVSVNFTQGQQPWSAGQTVTEFTVSKCPGLIDSSNPSCYMRSPFLNYSSISIYQNPLGDWVDQTTLGRNGCWAPQSEGPWYINVRWTYPNCPLGGGCGFSLQWGAGSW